MLERTRNLWAKQNQHDGDRLRLFRAVAEALDVTNVLYPGSYVDVAPSFVWKSVTYVDMDRRAAAFFGDHEGVNEIISENIGAPADPEVNFISGDYTTKLDLSMGSFDLLVSLYAGPVTKYCTQYLREGGFLLVNPSHGDAALASIDDRYRLNAVVQSRSGGYAVTKSNLDSYMIPKASIDVTADLIARTGRGVAYTKPAFAYIFKRVG